MTRRTLTVLSFSVLALLAQTGCGGAAPPMAPAGAALPAPAPAPPSADEAAPTVAQASAAPGAPVPGPGGSPAPAPKSAPAQPARADGKSAKSAASSVRAPVIIYQGQLQMLAEQEGIPKAIDRVIDVAEELGGHLAGRTDDSVTIKVPSASFRDALGKIEAIGGVTSRSVKADDVSEEFHDLEVRLTNLRATRQRLQEFMAKANTVSDMLTVERELERVASEIDRITGRLEFLRSRAAMSVITVGLRAKPKASPIVKNETTAPAKAPNLPIPWVHDVGIDPLMTLKK